MATYTLEKLSKHFELFQLTPVIEVLMKGQHLFDVSTYAQRLEVLNKVGSTGIFALCPPKEAAQLERPYAAGFVLLALSSQGEKDLLDAKVKGCDFKPEQLADMRDFLDGTENADFMHLCMEDVGYVDNALYMPALGIVDDMWQLLFPRNQQVKGFLIIQLQAYQKSGFSRLYMHAKNEMDLKILNDLPFHCHKVQGHDNLYVVNFKQPK